MYNVSVGAVDSSTPLVTPSVAIPATRSQPEGVLSSTRPNTTPSLGSWSLLALALCPYPSTFMLLLASALLLPAMLGWSPMTSPSDMRSRMTSFRIACWACPGSWCSSCGSHTAWLPHCTCLHQLATPSSSDARHDASIPSSSEACLLCYETLPPAYDESGWPAPSRP